MVNAACNTLVAAKPQSEKRISNPYEYVLVDSQISNTMADVQEYTVFPQTHNFPKYGLQCKFVRKREQGCKGTATCPPVLTLIPRASMRPYCSVDLFFLRKLLSFSKSSVSPTVVSASHHSRENSPKVYGFDVSLRNEGNCKGATVVSATISFLSVAACFGVIHGERFSSNSSASFVPSPGGIHATAL